MNASWGACREVKENQVGSNSSLSIDRMILFPVEIDHLNIVTKTYYFYLDTVSGTKSLWDLHLPNSANLITASAVSLSVFGKAMTSEAISVIHLKIFL